MDIIPVSYTHLPATVDGENVSYYRQMENRGLIVIGMIVLSTILFYALDKEKQKEKMQEKEKQMLLDYPEAVNKLTLFLGYAHSGYPYQTTGLSNEPY